MTSIHQPNTDVLKLFDQLYVLLNRGQCIYNNHPSEIKKHLNECQIELLNYQVPIEELIKVASSTHSNDVIVNNLIRKTFERSISSLKYIKYGKLQKKSLFQENKSFNWADVLILLRRTAKNELIGGWKIQISSLICYLLTIFALLYLFPNNIGSDPGCTENAIDLRNISSINQRIVDVIMGNQQKFQQNIIFMFVIMYIIYFFNVIQLSYMFSCENQVKIIDKLIKIIFHFYFRYF